MTASLLRCLTVLLDRTNDLHHKEDLMLYELEATAGTAAYSGDGQEVRLRDWKYFSRGEWESSPHLLYDPGNVKALGKAIATSEEIIRYCVGPGGALAGNTAWGWKRTT